MKNIFLVLLISCSNICCMHAQNIERKIIFSYKGESDKPIPTIILSVNEFRPKGYPYYEFYRIDEKLFELLNQKFEQSKALIKLTSERESLYEISVTNKNQLNRYICMDKECIQFTLSEIINALVINKSPADIIKSFENINYRLK